MIWDHDQRSDSCKNIDNEINIDNLLLLSEEDFLKILKELRPEVFNWY